MGAYFTVLILDTLRGWVGSSENAPLVPLTETQIAEWQDMEDRHERERQKFLREAFSFAGWLERSGK